MQVWLKIQIQLKMVRIRDWYLSSLENTSSQKWNLILTHISFCLYSVAKVVKKVILSNSTSKKDGKGHSPDIHAN